MKKRMILWVALLAISQVLTGVTQAFVLCIEEGGGISIDAALDCACLGDDEAPVEAHSGPDSHGVDASETADNCGPCTDIPLTTDAAYVARTDLRSKSNLSNGAMKSLALHPALALPSRRSLRKPHLATPNRDRLPIYLKRAALLI